MIDSLKSFFEKSMMSAAENVHEVDQNRIAIATSVILLELAHADRDFDLEEEQKITEIIQEKFSVERHDLKEILAIAEKERRNSHDLWQFTNLINQNFNNDEKRSILEMIWQIAFIDKKINKYEDYLIRKITKLLHLAHSDMIDTKIKVKYQNKE